MEERIAELSAVSQNIENMKEENKLMKKDLKANIKDKEISEQKYKEEVKKRKKLHNQIEDMKGKIRVFARVRPSNERESGRDVTTIPDEMTLNIDTKNGLRSYHFDNVFGPHSTQEEIFDETARLVQSAIDGFNVCVFAYGQTGSGKTHTIMGPSNDPGLTPRVFEELFELIDSMDNYDVSLSCYMVELYLEQLTDLLRNNKKAKESLEIKENAHGMVVIPGAVELEITNLEEANRIFEYGLENRKTAQTQMNATSSRSHLIFSIVINSRNRQTKQRTIGKLSLVDLAGSERVSKTGATADRLKEANAINKSLSALGNVISILGEGKGGFVPYRDNKLTMIMKDSLGGNAKSLMFVNVSPAESNMDESNTSLQYAERVKRIKNIVVKNFRNKQSDKMNEIMFTLQGEIA